MSDAVPVRSDRCGLDELFLACETGDAERARLALGPGWTRQWTATWRVLRRDELALVRDLESVPVVGCEPVRRFSWGRRQHHRCEQATRDRYAIRGYASTAAKHGHQILTVIRDALKRKRRSPDAQCFFYHDAKEVLRPRRRARDKLERGDRWRRTPTAWTSSAPLTSRQGAPPFRIDLTGLEAFDSDSPALPWAWFESRTGNATLMGLTDPVGLPEAQELDGIRRMCARSCAENDGCLLELDIRRLGGRAALYQLWKQRQRESEHGFAFSAIYLVPVGRGTAVLKYEASERGITGMRETLVLVKLGATNKSTIPHPYDPDLKGGLAYLRSDAPAWDTMFPDHPLSQARAWSRLMERTAVLEGA